MDDEYIIDDALLLASGNLPDGVKESNDTSNNIQESHTSKEDLHLKDENSKTNKEEVVIGNTYQMYGKDYILTPKGLKRPGSEYATYSYELSIKLIKKHQEINSSQTKEVIGNTYQVSGRDYILTPEGLKRLGSEYATYSYESSIELIKKNQEIKVVQPDIDISEALQDPYRSMEQLIAKTFLYSSPVYIILKNINFKLENSKSIGYIEKLSDKHNLEKMIIKAEKKYLELFQLSISNTRQDMLSLIQVDIGTVFSYDQQTLNSLHNEIKNYRNILSPKMAELYNMSQQLKQYRIQVKEGEGKGIEKVIRAGGLGLLGSALLGPVGVAAALGAAYLNENNDIEKKSRIENTLNDNWSKSRDSFYLVQLKDYYQAYRLLGEKISRQFIENYKKAEQQAEQNNKKTEFDRYIISEVTGLVSGKEFISMRKELSSMEKMFT